MDMLVTRGFDMLLMFFFWLFPRFIYLFFCFILFRFQVRGGPNV